MLISPSHFHAAHPARRQTGARKMRIRKVKLKLVKIQFITFHLFTVLTVLSGFQN